MSESNKENKLKNNNQKEIIDEKPKLKEKLLTEDENINNKKEKNNILNNPLIEVKNKKKINKKKSKRVNRNNNIKLLDDNKNDISNITIPSFRNSNINRESFKILVEENNNIIDKKNENNNTNNLKIKIILLIIEIFLGLLINTSSILVLLILYKDYIADQKLIAFIVEPIIFFITFFGIIPYKGKICKQIIIPLYIWEGLFLFPLTFYARSGIKDEFLYDICNQILIARIFLLLVQLFNFILSLLLEVNI